MPRSVNGLIETYPDNMATYSEFNTLVAHPAHVVWLDFTERKKGYMIDQRHSLLWFLLIGAAELREGNEKQNVDESMIKHGFASTEVMPLEDAKAQTCYTGAQKKRIGMLGRAISTLLRVLEEIFEGGLKVEVRGREISS